MTKGEETKARIIRTAIQQFGHKGYFLTSLDIIARGAEVQRPAIINYFDNKLGLFKACIQNVMDEFASDYSKRRAELKDAVSELDLSFELNLEMARKKTAHAKLIVLLYYGATVDPELHAVYASTLVGIRKRYFDLISKAILEKKVRKVKDPDTTSQLMHEAIMGMMINYVSATEGLSPTMMQKKWKLLKQGLLGV